MVRLAELETRSPVPNLAPREMRDLDFRAADTFAMTFREQEGVPPIHRLADLATAYSTANAPPEIRRQAGVSLVLS